MFVKDIMTTNPISITIDSPMIKAYNIMRDNNFKQLPVVNNDNELAGIITLDSIERVSPSSNLNNYEIKYLLNKTKIQEIMNTGIYVINQNTIIENAALSLKENRINSICVIDDDKHLVGIVTVIDIFKSLINLMQIRVSGTRLHLSTSIGNDVYKQLSCLFSDNGIKICNFCTTYTDTTAEITIKLLINDISEDIKNKLKNMGYTIKYIHNRM